MTAINEKVVAELPAPPSGNKLHYFSGATLQGKKAPSGFAVRVTAAGTKSFVLFYRSNGKPHLDTIGTWSGNEASGKYTVLQGIVAARARADELNRPGSVADPRPARTRALEDGKRPIGKTVADVIDEHVTRYVEREAKLRNAPAIKSTFERLVKPSIGAIGIYDVRRSHVVAMLDKIADENGPVMADRALAYLTKAFNWFAARDDDFVPPIAKGMARVKAKERARTRILSDDEIRVLWTALDAVTKPACYAPYLKFLFHTGTRLNEAALMRWDEIDGNTWTIPASRYKTKRDHAVPLTDTALALIGERPKDIEQQSFVFSPYGGARPLTNHQQAWAALQRAIAELRNGKPLDHWVAHDLRRTARSLMSRAGVPFDHAERALGHVVGNIVAETYDRHKYLDEKRRAFEALDALLGRILKPAKNVTDIAARRRG